MDSLSTEAAKGLGPSNEAEEEAQTEWQGQAEEAHGIGSFSTDETKELGLSKEAEHEDRKDCQGQTQTTQNRDFITPEVAKELGFSMEAAEQARKKWQESGAEGFVEFLTEQEETFRKMKLNIAVTGLSGCGKSSFINRMRQLKPSHELAAKVGPTETTDKPTSYVFPENPQVLLWDVPGVGTKNFPKERYLEDINFQVYDFFLILSSSRFREDDAWLGNESAKISKKFFYVKTKVDQDIESESYDHPERSTDEVVESIRLDAEKNLKKHVCQEPQIFLVGRKFEKDEMDKLKQKLKDDCPDIKKDQLILAFSAVTKTEIEEKVDVLSKRLWRCAVKAATVSAIRIPGLEIAANLSLIGKELQYYYEQLGLSGDRLKRIAETSGCDEKLLIDVAEKAYPKIQLTTTAITRGLLSTVAVGAAAIALSFATGGVALTVLGAAIAVDTIAIGKSYRNVLNVLQKSLDDMKKAAETVAEVAMAKSIKALPSHDV